MRASLAFVAAFVGAAAGASPDGDPGLLVKHARYSLNEALAKAAPLAGASIPVRAELNEEAGKVVYAMEYSQGNQTIDISLDAGTGEIVRKAPQAEDTSCLARALKVPLGRALEVALERVPGRALSVSGELEEGRARIEVRILASGKVSKVILDAGTGEVIKVKTQKEKGAKMEKSDASRQNG